MPQARQAQPARLPAASLLVAGRHGKSAATEFKSSFQQKMVTTFIAFANTQGGIALMGVNDAGNSVDVA